MNSSCKTLHLFWGRSRPLSWLRLQTVRTFAALNPDWTIKIWWRDAEPVKPFWPTHEQRNPYTGRDYFAQLATVPGVELHRPCFDFALPDVPFSDYLRWHLLATEGGFWSDFDIVYVKPMSCLDEEIEGPFLIQYPCGAWPIGFLGSTNKEALWFFDQVKSMASQRLRRLSGYQDIGCVILGRIMRTYTKAKVQPHSLVYPHYRVANAMSAYFDPRADYPVPEESIGLHWYAGAEKAAAFENSIDQCHLTAQQRKTAIIRAIESVG